MKRFSILSLLLVFALCAHCKVKLAPIFQNGMVLQQQQACNLWGWASPGATVTVKTSWKEKASAKADAEGRWALQIRTPRATFAPQSLTVSDGQRTELQDVLIGEVWLASGQSNMEMGVAGRPNRVIENVNRELLSSARYAGRVRFATVEHNAQAVPSDTVRLRWEDSSPATVGMWSAVAYFFATTLTDALDVPVGIVGSYWGGTTVESWSPASVLPAPATEAETKDFSVRYNGMIRPIERFTLRGFLWYQGESNVAAHAIYADRLSKMITAWRAVWQQGDLPFYQVEIAPYLYGNALDTRAALLREAQWDVNKRLTHVSAVTTNDLVLPDELRQIHPMKKREIGERLAYLALTHDYGFKGLYADAPEFQKMEVKDGKAILSFTNAKAGFNRFDNFRGFEICGPDSVFHPGEAKLDGVRIVVTSPKVERPVAVRYCFRNFLVGNVTNVGGMPLVPFRSDR